MFSSCSHRWRRSWEPWHGAPRREEGSRLVVHIGTCWCVMEISWLLFVQFKLSFPWFAESERGRRHEHTPRSDPQRAFGAGPLCCVCSLRALPFPRLSARVSTSCCWASVWSHHRCWSCTEIHTWGGIFTEIPRWWRSRENLRVWTDFLLP